MPEKPKRPVKRVEPKTNDSAPLENGTESLAADLGPVSGQGRAGGRLARDIATADELKRAFERPAGATRVRKSDDRG